MEYALNRGKESPEEVIVWVSDLHLGSGLYLPDGSKDILEEFEHDYEFSRFISTILSRFQNIPKVRLKLGGDIFDSQSVFFHGRNYDMPYEAVHRYKMKKIIRGHTRVFDSLSRFLESPGRTVDIFIGNHDFFLEWAGVQKMVVLRIAKNCPEKVRFLYSEDHQGVHYFHGNIEPHTVTPENKYLTTRYGVKLKRPLLNYPYGTFLTVDLANRLKLKNPLVGRLRANGLIWVESALRDWYFGIFALALYVWVFIHNRFFAFWDLRKKASFATTIKILLWTMTGYDLKEYARRIFENRPEIKVVVCGHDHEAMRVTISRGPKSGTYINSGTWTRCYDKAEEPEFYSWNSFRSLERPFRNIKRKLRRPKLVSQTKLTFVLVEHFSDGSLNARLMEFKPYSSFNKQIRELI